MLSVTPSCLGPFVNDAVDAVAVGRVVLSSFISVTGFALARGAVTAGRLCAGRNPRCAKCGGCASTVSRVQGMVAVGSWPAVVARGGAVGTDMPMGSSALDNGRVQEEGRTVPLARAITQERGITSKALGGDGAAPR